MKRLACTLCITSILLSACGSAPTASQDPVFTAASEDGTYEPVSNEPVQAPAPAGTRASKPQPTAEPTTIPEPMAQPQPQPEPEPEPVAPPACTPATCPVDGDGTCTSSENASTSPLDCPPSAGDGHCTHNETPVSAPADCAPVAGDGFCTHQESAVTTPQDCPAVAGDGFCTHGERADTAPADCPAVAGDGLCTHDENANTFPNDCPPVAGDGFCTHSETYQTAPGDCPPPSFTGVDVDVDDLLAVSSDLTFTRLEITGEFELDGYTSIPIIADEFIMPVGSTVTWDAPGCGTGHAPTLEILANTSVLMQAYVSLGGESGDGETPTSTCNSCLGGDGGNLRVTAPVIQLEGDVYQRGGHGDSAYLTGWPSFVQVGCSGGDGGVVELTATDSMEISSQILQRAGPGGYGPNGSGSDGSQGALFLAGTENVVFLETTANNYWQGQAQQLAFYDWTLQGQIANTQTLSTGSMSLPSLGGIPNYIDDLYLITNHRSDVGTASFRFDLDWTGPAPLQIYLISLNFGIVASGAPGGANHRSFTVSGPSVGDVYYLAVDRGFTPGVSSTPNDYVVTATQL